MADESRPRPALWKRIMSSPWTILGSIIVGVYVGLQQQELARAIAPFGNIYLALLQMCVLPILVTAVVASLGKLLSEGNTGSFLLRMVGVILIGLLLGGSLALVVAEFAAPGEITDPAARDTIGRQLHQSEMAGLEMDADKQKAPGFAGFLQAVIPDNVFASLSRGEIVSVLFFCLLLGPALAVAGRGTGQRALGVVCELYEAFSHMLEWLMYGLPVGMLCLFAGQIESVGGELLKALGGYVLWFYLGAVGLMLALNMVVAIATGKPYLRSFFHLRQPLAVALGTASSMAALPSAMRSLRQDFHLDRNGVDVVMPINITLNPLGSVVYYAYSAVFVAQLYETPLTLADLPILLVGAVLAGMAGTSTPGLAAVGLIAILIKPLGLPVGAAVILLMTVYPAMDPIITLVNVHGNCAITSLIVHREDNQNALEAESNPSGAPALEACAACDPTNAEEATP